MCSMYLGRTAEAVRPIPFLRIGNFFESELFDIADAAVVFLKYVCHVPKGRLQKYGLTNHESVI